MERQTYLFHEMTLAHEVFGKLYFEEYLAITTEESRIAYMEWYRFHLSIRGYQNTPKDERSRYLFGQINRIL